MEPTYESLAQRVLQKWTEAQTRGQHRLIIALAGPPGSGKTTIANQVVELVTKCKGPRTVSISADGFHLTQATLRAMPNADEAFARRGAPWTFDGQGVVDLVRQLKYAAGDVVAPTFDHAVKDPVPNGLTIASDMQVCIMEGNYLLSDEPPWASIADYVDDRWLVHVDAGLATRRVALRHLQAGIETTMEAAMARAEGNDKTNGDYVMDHSKDRYDVCVESIEDMAL